MRALRRGGVPVRCLAVRQLLHIRDRGVELVLGECAVGPLHAHRARRQRFLRRPSSNDPVSKRSRVVPVTHAVERIAGVALTGDRMTDCAALGLIERAPGLDERGPWYFR
jgi:hypothetical protein